MDEIFDLRDKYAYDMSIDTITKGEVFDDDAIKLSIQNILSTNYGERIFNPYFGSILTATLFENIVSEQDALNLLNSLLDTIELWEDRIILDKDNASIEVIMDENTIELSIPYTIKSNYIKSSFDKRIIF